jgi:hypothetical protein
LDKWLLSETEPVIRNSFGDMAQTILPQPGWHDEYQEYLRQYAQAKDKVKFNVEWFKHGRNRSHQG